MLRPAMTSVTIYHNPRCSKSRETLALIRAAGIEPAIVEYLQTPPDAVTLKALLHDSGMHTLDAMRNDVAEYSRSMQDWPDERLIAAIAANPRLLNRPFVRTPKGVRLCRPPELVHEIL